MVSLLALIIASYMTINLQPIVLWILELEPSYVILWFRNQSQSTVPLSECGKSKALDEKE